MTDAERRADKRAWVSARLAPLPQRGRTRTVIAAHEAERKRLSDGYDRLTKRQEPKQRVTTGQLTERELALIGGAGYGGKRE